MESFAVLQMPPPFLASLLSVISDPVTMASPEVYMPAPSPESLRTLFFITVSLTSRKPSLYTPAPFSEVLFDSMVQPFSSHDPVCDTYIPPPRVLFWTDLDRPNNQKLRMTFFS
ncbi:MAG TPA: hypothetical protein DCP06_03445 [Lachnospiraceae bacterium]|nr:hypothetical protein [Lachnospiraceae bacterium]